MAKLPDHIFFVEGARRNRPYVTKGHVKQALNHYRSGCKVYRAKVIEWEDVTEEFKKD